MRADDDGVTIRISCMCIICYVPTAWLCACWVDGENGADRGKGSFSQNLTAYDIAYKGLVVFTVYIYIVYVYGGAGLDPLQMHIIDLSAEFFRRLYAMYSCARKGQIFFYHYTDVLSNNLCF